MTGLDSSDTILINVSLDVTHFRVQTFNLGWFGLLNLKMLEENIILFVLYLGRESNPHGHYCPRDFKSLVSTISPPRRLWSRMDLNQRPHNASCAL